MGCGGSKPAPESAAEPPGVIDSHVHLSYWDVAKELVEHGVVAAVDLGGPIDSLDDAWPLVVIGSGPMITSPGGYPVDAWAPPTYGLPCADAACASAAVDQLAAAGARVIKLPFAPDGVDPAVGKAAADAAHAKDLPVACHALSDADALAAAAAGCDVLAHTPVEPLGVATINAWRGRAVISTLAAFGGSDAAVDNLRTLREAGATVLYGTDLGNRRVAGVDDEELRLLGKAGLDDDAIRAAMTTAPAAFWKIDLVAARVSAGR
jgi:hypothetical protein